METELEKARKQVVKEAHNAIFSAEHATLVEAANTPDIQPTVGVVQEQISRLKETVLSEYWPKSQVMGMIEQLRGTQKSLQEKIDDVKSKEWKLKFRGRELVGKQLVVPVASVIEWAEDFVGKALEASVYGSLAWSGVCLLLPV